jgi:hypothetical protein
MGFGVPAGFVAAGFDSVPGMPGVGGAGAAPPVFALLVEAISGALMATGDGFVVLSGKVVPGAATGDAEEVGPGELAEGVVDAADGTTSGRLGAVPDGLGGSASACFVSGPVVGEVEPVVDAAGSFATPPVAAASATFARGSRAA